jgi:hypothetical protein
MKRIFSLAAIAGSLFFISLTNTHAAVITFNDAISGAATYQFDSDGDGIKDVIFSTSDPSGFQTAGPGTNMTYISEPGLEGTSLLNPDLRVDFLNMAKDNLKFGFALNSSLEHTSFYVYDASGNLLVSQTVDGLFTKPDGTNLSNFPEGQISVTFSGIASYALFDFSSSSESGRYIIDNFEGTFGSTEVPPNTVPEPATLFLFGFGFVGLAGFRKKLLKK